MRALPFVWIVSIAAAALVAGAARSEPLTKVYVNGEPTPVFFNDGDSFRMQAGPFRGTQARLSGYNTLESFGAVHSWGTWTETEMFALAKLATLEGRKGVWHCEGDGKKDTYGRLLLFCKDLAIHLIKNGLAHTYSVDENPGDADLLAAQKDAIKNKRGMWAHGVPRFVMTSLHSKDEGGGKDGITSNRLISTHDGHSEKWVHNDTYAECQKVCHEVPVPTDAELDAMVAAVNQDANAAAALQGLDANAQRAIVAAFVSQLARTGTLDTVKGGTFELTFPPNVWGADPGLVEVAGRVATVQSAMKKLHEGGQITMSGKVKDTCHIYVDFRRRFGGERAACLRK